ncbi:MAG TPA: glycine oxidase ThiO [Candidatus Cybelea sp.]|nr:glycine oxidase ThiO [Candidatus Cybelea sp.]
MKTYDVTLVGGGIIGISAAFELAERRLHVLVLDRQECGREASWAAAGMLAPGTDDPDSAALVPLMKRSLELYPEFVGAIEQASRKTTGFAREGTLEVFFGAAGESERDRFVREHIQLGLSAKTIPLPSAREMEPWLGPHASAAAWLPDEATVDPRLLVDAAVTAAQARGVEIRSHCPVNRLRLKGRRCVGVAAGGEEVSSHGVVITAGCFSACHDDEIAHRAPTHPVRGQMIALRPASPGLKLRRVLRSANGYLVPRSDGRMLAGSTLEKAGFEKVVTPEGLAKIIRAALELAPALAGAEIVETWAGLRPGTPDNLPILGQTDIEGLFVATGHYRNGILLAPITGKLVARWISGEKTGIDQSAFSPLRFIDRTAPHML